ncbi:hypothetical protein Dsin_000181 [Dipteronia sinensis]|uniref:Peptide chain release factor domain-containing protein n=1 Tax=Dipteronia sinensis TaxID=43782 RepID=A0AAD9Z1Q7_9ROSI|nr:hypothetical protein Dsin_000181 [Dipteronia sinensis]
MGCSSVISPEDVLESLMSDGTIDSLRLKIIDQLKANEELKNTTIKMAEQSKVLNTSGAEKQSKRELFDALRQELELTSSLLHESLEALVTMRRISNEKELEALLSREQDPCLCYIEVQAGAGGTESMD